VARFNDFISTAGIFSHFFPINDFSFANEDQRKGAGQDYYTRLLFRQNETK